MARLSVKRTVLTLVGILSLCLCALAQSGDEKLPKLTDPELKLVSLVVSHDTGFNECIRTAVTFVHARGSLTEKKLEQSFTEIQAAYPEETNLAVIFLSDPTYAKPFPGTLNAEKRRNFERAIRGLYYRGLSPERTISKLYPDGLTDDAIAAFVY